jgi:REP element-mobilizing transposase RayT
MSRQWRIEYPGAIYHVISRGNNRQGIFKTKVDRNLFLELLKEMTERYGIHVHAYVLMGNHYHLLLKTPDPNLSRAMQWFGTSYTRKFNLNNNASGHLFQGRFKSILVENDAYLLRLSCYIHRNPVRAGIVERLADYPWSSYRYYAYNKKPPAWLTTQAILSQLSGNKGAHGVYRDKVQHYSDETSRVLEDIKHGFILGSQNFVEELKSRFLKDRKDGELPQHNRLYRAFDPKMLIKSASEVLDFNLSSARKSKRISLIEKEKRDMLVYLLWKTGRMTNQEIGEWFGVSYSSISKIVSGFGDRLLAEKGLRRRYNNLNSLIKV